MHDGFGGYGEALCRKKRGAVTPRMLAFCLIALRPERFSLRACSNLLCLSMYLFSVASLSVLRVKHVVVVKLRVRSEPVITAQFYFN